MLSALKNPLNLPEADLNTLAQAVQPASAIDAELPDRLLHYLVDDNGDRAAIAQVLAGVYHHPQVKTLSLQLFKEPLFLAWRSGLIPAIFDAYLQLGLLWRKHFIRQIHEAADGQIQRPALATFLPDFITQVSPKQPFREEHQPVGQVAADIIDALYETVGEAPGYLARLVYCESRSSYRQQSLARHAVHLRGFAQYTQQHADIVRQGLQQADYQSRIDAWDMLVESGAPLDPWLEPLVDAAISSAQAEREALQPLLLQQLPAAMPLLQTRAESGKANQRQQAIALLWELEGEALRPFLEQCLAQEKVARVKAVLEERLHPPTAPVAEKAALTLPPLPDMDLAAAVPEAAIAILESMVPALNQGRVASRRSTLQGLKKYHQSGKRSGFFQAQKISQENTAAILQLLDEMLASPALEETAALPRFSAILDQHYGQTDISLEQLIQVLQQGDYAQCRRHVYWVPAPFSQTLKRATKALLALPPWSLPQAVRLVTLRGGLQKSPPLLLEPDGHELLSWYREHHPDSGGLRELAAVLAALQVPPEQIATEMLDFWRGSGFWHWENAAIWPYYAARLPLLASALAGEVTAKVNFDQAKFRRHNALRSLTTFPAPPAQFADQLWELALTGNQVERRYAQTCFNSLADTPERLVTALTDKRYEARMTAATWLSDRGDVAAIPPLKQALQQEKSEVAHDAMLRSLEKLGARIDDLLDRQALLQDCQQLLKKGIPAALEWFPFDQLPAVHWHDTGEAVAPDILQGLLVQGWKQKTSEPGPLLKRYAALWQPAERQALGQFVLEQWIAQDTRPLYTPEEADRLAQDSARSSVQHYHQMAQQYPNHNPGPAPDYDQLYRTYYNDYRRECLGSATKEKGILAIAAACCGPLAIPPIQSYLQSWYGQRLSQCKALLPILAWMADHRATQWLIAVASRFRTKGIQQEAAKLVKELAERQGWSPEELSDRTLPTAGFDEGGKQILDYGSRQFTLLLAADLSLVLKNAEGEVIKSLPAARQDDDPEEVKVAKKQFSEAKKQLKQVLKLQKERLYEAMCTQRTWRFEDWDTYLNHHPIVGRYCQQLVWAIYTDQGDGETLVGTVRPLDDRTLTNTEDAAVTLDPEARVRLAHSCTLSAAAIAAWQTHFADYEVTPLFPQFASDPYVLPAAQSQDTELKDFEGYRLEALTLRGLLTQRGYQRGDTEEGSWFYDYRQAFPSLGLEAVIGFSGNFLPEENRTVALTTLAFYRLPASDEVDDQYSRFKVALETVPPVLLSEVYGSLRAIAAQGSGYDPNWEKQVEF